MNYFDIFRDILKQYSGPKFAVRLGSNKDIFFGEGSQSAFTLIIRDEITVKRLLSEGSLGFGESYIDGDLDIEGDIESYLFLRHNFKKIRFSPSLAIAKLLAGYSVPKKRRDQIAYHYDQGNDFFEMILDKNTMSYSSGMYNKPFENLGSAQLNKIKFICKWLDLPKSSNILDLGSGWGGFANYGAKKYGWKITGYTLSKAQLEYCYDLTKKAKLEKLVKFEYRDILSDSVSDKLFDGIVMIESIEHVGKKNLPTFFKQIKTLLKPNAPFVLQFTGRYIPKRVDRWTLKYVFPGGYLPSKEEIFNAAKKFGLVVEEFRDDTNDYIKTISAWINNLETHQTKIEKMFDKRFYRLWYLWMHGAKVNFELKEMSLFRIKIRNQ